MIIQYLGLVTAALSMAAAGYIYARIKLRMRVLPSGALLAFGILHIHNIGDSIPIISLATHIAIVVSILYFAVVANKFVELAAATSKVTTDVFHNPKSIKEKVESDDDTKISLR